MNKKKDGTPFADVIGRTTEESSPAWLESPPRPLAGARNVMFFVLDDIGCGKQSSFRWVGRDARAIQLG
jgi:hypothetical protein